MFNTISLDILGRVIGGSKIDKDPRAGNDDSRDSHLSRGDGRQERKAPITIDPAPKLGG